ncbi:MAG: alpha-L-rhamnosidase C-terminal domain-containing protein [Planctomycetota bacterium]
MLQRIFTAPHRLEADGNIRPHYVIESASWIWHPDAPPGEPVVLLFENHLTLDAPCTVRLHLSADQRYEFFVDGQWMAIGPDRSDVDHWSFASYEVSLEAGDHVLAVRAWSIGDHAPMAQLDWRGGFILAAEGPLHDKLTTGVGPWTVRREDGWSFEQTVASGFIGSACVIKPVDTPSSRCTPDVVLGPLEANDYGTARDGWRLHPSNLPDQVLEPRRGGTVRAVSDTPPTEGRTVEAPHVEDPHVNRWTALLKDDRPVELPAGQSVSVLLECDDYLCGYPEVHLAGGAGASLTIGWAESLYEVDRSGTRNRNKGRRDRVQGKTFFGTHDRLVHDGSTRAWRPLWWRAGRYVLLSFEVGDQPLVIQRIRVIETRYPLERTSTFSSDDAELQAMHPMLLRGLQMCAHETYMDCPFWEQLMYVGDTRLEVLTTFVTTDDDRLPRRALELFDWSSRRWSMVAERYPSRHPQLSPTFSLIWVMMVRDAAWWRDDPQSIRRHLPAMRNVLEQFRHLSGDDGLLGRLPGWPFVDWVPAWSVGNAPGGTEGDSSINNLFYVAALRSAAEVEHHLGDPVLAHRNAELADDVSRRILDRWWHDKANLLADDSTGEHVSEHAQCLALLYDVLPVDRRQKCFEALLNRPDLARATVYFSFYLLEVFKRFGRGDLIREKLDDWSTMVELGLRTPLEQPEPSRSDCHAWGSHPLFHMHASLAGIRPSSPGFQTVEIAPLVEGNLHCTTPHPRGVIELKIKQQDNGRHVEVNLPDDVTGTFRWAATETQLEPGTQSFEVPG